MKDNRNIIMKYELESVKRIYKVLEDQGFRKQLIRLPFEYIYLVRLVRKCCELKQLKPCLVPTDYKVVPSHRKESCNLEIFQSV